MKQRLFDSLDNTSPPIYDDKGKDRLTRLHYLVPFFVFIPVILFFAYRALAIKGVAWFHFVWLFLLMAFFWSLLEYILHRYMLHRNKYGFMNLDIANKVHEAHHAYPNDDYRLVVNLWGSIPGGFVFYGICYLVFGFHLVDAAFASLVSYYLVYEFAHISAHKIDSNNPILLGIKKHHLKHHFQDDQKGFGFTSPVWDQLWGTEFEKSGRNERSAD